MSQTYHNDNYIRIDHSPVSNSTATANNAIGATTSTTLRTIDYTPSDSNSIYVNSSTGSGYDYSNSIFITPTATSVNLVTGDVVFETSTGSVVGYWEFLASDESDVDLTTETYVEGARWTEITDFGTSGNPVNSIWFANELITATKTKIYITDSATYSENRIIFNDDFEGIYSAVGYAPKIDISVGAGAPGQQIDLTDYQVGPVSGWCVLENGDIFVIYGSLTQTFCRTIDGTTLQVNDDETLVTNTDFTEFAPCLTEDGDIFVCALDSFRNVNYFVLDKDDFTNFIKANTTFKTGTYYKSECIRLKDGKFLISYDNATNIYYGIIDTDFTIDTNDTLLLASRTHPQLNRVKSGEILFSYLNSGAINYKELDDSLSTITGETATGISSVAQESQCGVLSDGRIIFLYDNNDFSPSAGRTFSFKVYETDYTYNSTIGEVAYNTHSGSELFMTIKDDNIVSGVVAVTGSPPYYLVYYSQKPIVNILEAPSGQAIKFDGIQLASGHSKGFENLILQQNDITFKHCTIRDIPNVAGASSLGFLNNLSAYEVTIQNCQFLDSYLRTYINSDDVSVSESIFFNIANNPALEIEGTSTGIILDHNTFFNVYGGILLTNNNGNEVIKNSIFYETTEYDVQCGTTLQITYCVSTGTLTTCTADSNTLDTNPYFINEGIDYTTNLDLNLKSKALGYNYTSLAIGNDDSSGDIGAYDRTIAYIADTYSIINIQKPDQIEIQYQSVNSSTNTNLDGTVRTYKDGASKVLTLKWTGILNEDYEDLLDFWLNHSGKVRVYLDPETNPSTYEIYWLDYNNINGSPKKSYLLSETGVSDVEIKLLKVYSG